MPAAAFQRKLLLATALALYALVFGACLIFEKPGLGIGHFFYIPVALAALAAGTLGGVAGGLLGAGLYALAIVLTPRLPTRDVLTMATVIRTVTYCSLGSLIGWFANEYRTHVATLRELADRDFLTGLLNTRAFDEALARRCASGKPFVLVLADVDDLHELNNAHGHTEGNRALRRVADAIRTAAAPRDHVARVGGDEFAVLTDGSVDEAKALIALLQGRLRREAIELSFAWAASPDDAAGPLELFRKADDRLLGAKLLRRNRRTVVALARATAQ